MIERLPVHHRSKQRKARHKDRAAEPEPTSQFSVKSLTGLVANNYVKVQPTVKRREVEEEWTEAEEDF
jgi:hypothetical protein